MRRRKYDMEAIRESIKIECPHCRERLLGNEYMRLHSPYIFRCLKYGKDFEYKGKSGLPTRTS